MNADLSLDSKPRQSAVDLFRKCFRGFRFAAFRLGRGLARKDRQGVRREFAKDRAVREESPPKPPSLEVLEAILWQ